MTLSGATTPDQMDLWAMKMKEYSAFPKAPALLESPDYLVPYPGHLLAGRWGVPTCRDAVGVFYSLSQLGYFNQGCWPEKNFSITF